MLAWLIWLSVHIFYLIGLQNRLLVLTRWAFSFVTRGGGARLITGESDPTTAAREFGGRPARVSRHLTAVTVAWYESLSPITTSHR